MVRAESGPDSLDRDSPCSLELVGPADALVWARLSPVNSVPKDGFIGLWKFKMAEGCQSQSERATAAWTPPRPKALERQTATRGCYSRRVRGVADSSKMDYEFHISRCDPDSESRASSLSDYDLTDVNRKSKRLLRVERMGPLQHCAPWGPAQRCASIHAICTYTYVALTRVFHGMAVPNVHEGCSDGHIAHALLPRPGSLSLTDRGLMGADHTSMEGLAAEFASCLLVMRLSLPIKVGGNRPCGGVRRGCFTQPKVMTPSPVLPLIQRGTLVAHLSANTSRGLTALLASTALGGIAVPLNRRWSAKQSAGALHRLGCRMLVTDHGLASRACAVVQELKARAGAGQGPDVELLILDGRSGQRGASEELSLLSPPGARTVKECECVLV